MKADDVAFVFSDEAGEDIAEAWWKMTARDMARIVCMAVERGGGSTVRLIVRELRLTGAA